MSHRNHIPNTVDARLDARLAPFTGTGAAREDLDVGATRSVTPHPERHQRQGLIKDLKLLFRALGAGNGVVPLGDNSRAARLLSQYANSLRSN